MVWVRVRHLSHCSPLQHHCSRGISYRMLIMRGASRNCPGGAGSEVVTSRQWQCAGRAVHCKRRGPGALCQERLGRWLWRAKRLGAVTIGYTSQWTGAVMEKGRAARLRAQPTETVAGEGARSFPPCIAPLGQKSVGEGPPENTCCPKAQTTAIESVVNEKIKTLTDMSLTPDMHTAPCRPQPGTADGKTPNHPAKHPSRGWHW